MQSITIDKGNEKCEVIKFDCLIFFIFFFQILLHPKKDIRNQPQTSTH